MLRRLFGGGKSEDGRKRDAAQLAIFRNLKTDLARVRPVDDAFILAAEQAAWPLA